MGLTMSGEKGRASVITLLASTVRDEKPMNRILPMVSHPSETLKKEPQ
jgi:hypothetical protein